MPEVRMQKCPLLNLLLCNLLVGFAISAVKSFLPQRSQRMRKERRGTCEFLVIASAFLILHSESSLLNSSFPLKPCNLPAQTIRLALCPPRPLTLFRKPLLRTCAQL